MAPSYATEAGKDLENFNQVEALNKYAHLGIDEEETEFYENFPEDERRKLIKKIDIRLVPCLALLYLAAHIDRANIGNAKIEGLDRDLGLTGVQYNIALSLFFVPYILLEVPSNVVLKKFKRPSYYMGMLVMSWGLIMTCTGFVKTFAGLLICRLLLGVAEAGFFPGAVNLHSSFYNPPDAYLH
jgi:sugar phosphate permease